MQETNSAADLGLIIKAMRHKAKLSQGKLAELAGLSRTAIQRLEGGVETGQLDTLFKVLNVLNIRLYADHPLLSKESE